MGQESAEPPKKPVRAKRATKKVGSAKASVTVDAQTEVPPAVHEALAVQGAPQGDDDQLDSQAPERASDEILAYLVKQAKAAKATMDAAIDEYAHRRADLWEASGHELGDLPEGAKFRAPRSSRSVDYKILERDYPEAYAKAVRVTEPHPDKPGSLYL